MNSCSRLCCLRTVLAIFLAMAAISGARCLSDVELPTVISGGSDHNIKRWDSSGKLIDTLGTLDDSVTVLRIAPDGSLLSGGADGLVKSWSLADARETRSITAGRSAVTAITVSPDGAVFAVGTADGKISLFNSATGKRLSETAAHAGAVKGLIFTPDGTELISGSADKTIRIWRTVRDSGHLEYRSNIAAHDEAVTGMAAAAGGSLFATVSDDGYLKTWHLDGGLVGRMKVCDHGVSSVAFSPDGRTIATGDRDGKIKLWNAQSSAPMSSVFQHERDRAVLALTFTVSGKALVSGGADKTVRYWNLENGQKIKTIAAHDGEVQALALAP